MNPKKTKARIGISIGDCNGIGPEVIMKALMDNRINKSITPVIYGHGRILSYYKKQLDLENFNFNQVRDVEGIQHKKINVINISEEAPEINVGMETSLAGAFALKAFDHAIKDLKEGKIDALVTAPLNKNNINEQGTKFLGHTDHLAQAVGSEENLMMMVAENFRVGLATTHCPISEVSSRLNKDLIKKKCQIMIKSLKDDFGVQKPKIAVLGLNPHAGEDGLLGSEENEIIKPAIAELKDQNHYVFGPYPADGFFGMLQQNRFDGVLAMYHDQGLIPFKSIAFDSGVNFTAGLPVIRTSPDHGTAYAIAGKNLADPGSMRAALFLAADVLKEHTTTEEFA